MPRNPLDRARLTRLAVRSHFQPPYLEKALRIAGLIAEMVSERVLAKSLVLKGGTALNVYHLSIPRLSVDADFNFVGFAEWQQVQEVRPEIDRLITAIGTEQGYRVVRQDYKVALQAYKLGYKGVSGNDDSVKIEINYSDRIPALLPLEMRQPWAELEIDSPFVPCLQLNELAGMKVAALCDRCHPRDLFDVAQVSGMTLRKELVRKIALFQTLISDPTLGTVNPQSHHGISERDIESDLRPLLRKSDRVNAKALSGQADTLTVGLLPLATKEQRAVDLLQRGQWDLASFFGSENVNPELAHHPGIMLRIRGPAVPRGVHPQTNRP